MGRMKRTISNIFKRNPSKEQVESQSGERTPLCKGLKDNLLQIKEMLGNSSDLVIREIRIGRQSRLPTAVVYTDGLADTKVIQEAVMKSLMTTGKEIDLELTGYDTALQEIKEVVLPLASVCDLTDFTSLYQAVLSGETVILVDGYAHGIAASTQGWDERGVQEPSAQTVIRGPREGFSENLRTNTALIRRKIKTPHLWLEDKVIGRLSQTNVAIMYIKGVANEKVVEEVRARLDRIDIDGILESGYIEELIQDETLTPFPTIFNTERPDAAAAALLEGRIVILVDGTPFVLIVPALFVQYFQSSEDYYQRSDFGLIRILRFLAFFIALLGPSLYIAIITFHQEMLPTPLLVNISAQREGVPFPAFVEALIMETTFEILREAGIRMPRAVGQAVSIVGALVIGQAAVEAGLISPAMIIVVSITAIASFVIPAYNLAISVRILRFALMGLASFFGLFGIFIGVILLFLHLNSLRSFGVPYMSPFSPFILEDQKDSLIRLPLWGMFARPRLISQQNSTREANPPTPKGGPANGKGGG